MKSTNRIYPVALIIILISLCLIAVTTYCLRHFKNSQNWGWVYVYDARYESPIGLVTNKAEDALIQALKQNNFELEFDGKKIETLQPLTITILIQTNYHPEAIIAVNAQLNDGLNQMLAFRFMAVQSGELPFVKFSHSAYFDRVGLCKLETSKSFYCEIN